MAGRSGAAAGIGDGFLPCGGGLREGDELRHRIDRNGRMHDQHISGRGDDRNRPEVLVRIEGQLLVRGSDSRSASCRAPFPACIRRAQLLAMTSVPMLPPAPGRFSITNGCLRLTDSLSATCPRDDVDRSAGHNRNDQLDQAVGIGLCGGLSDRPRAASERHDWR